MVQAEEVAGVDAASVVEKVGKGAASPGSVDPLQGGAVLEAAVVVDSGCLKEGVSGVLSSSFGGDLTPSRNDDEPRESVPLRRRNQRPE